MSPNNLGMRPWSFWVAAAVACTLFAGNLAAKDHTVTVALHISAQGLDLSQPEGVRAYYARLRHAAWVVCTRGDRVGLEPLDDPMRCAEQALGVAVHSSRLPALTQIYLASHTLEQAEACGINILLQAQAHRWATEPLIPGPLAVLEPWVEKSQGPKQIIASAPDTNPTQPTCAHPKQARLISTSADPAVASSYQCVNVSEDAGDRQASR